MQLRHFHRQGTLWLALLALVMYLLLPFAHAYTMQSDPLAALNQLCSTSSSKITASTPANLQTNSSTDSPSAHGMPACPSCAVQAGNHLAPPPAPSALPSIREHVSSLRLTRTEGFFIPTSIYTLPPSHAPPQRG
ncbi:DUF2946 family protein [Chitinibacter sp. FCG-7]|uniref:DUF2946 family protein n=1 Tax=Chitinibacter mangrovi TaxID=3153927 RepID=A0AAU7FC85_9NEIS